MRPPITNLPSRLKFPARRHGRITQSHTSATNSMALSPSKIRSATRFHVGIRAGPSRGAGAKSASESTHRVRAAAATASHSTAMAAHTVTAPAGGLVVGSLDLRGVDCATATAGCFESFGRFHPGSDAVRC